MISVCMAVYNGEKYIYEQIRSILKQLEIDDELVISDDGSSDGTCEIIESFNDNRIRLIKNEGAHGFTRNFENALHYARGNYIFLSDQDDVWEDRKVAVTMAELQNHDLVISDCKTVDADLNVISKSRFNDFNIKTGFIRHLLKSRFLGCCMAFRKSILDVSLPFPERDDLVEHDIWLAAVAFLYFDVKLIDDQLILYRRHGKNSSKGGFTKGYFIVNKLYRRLYRCYKLFKIKNKVETLKKSLDIEKKI